MNTYQKNLHSGPKTSLNNIKKTQIIPTRFSHSSGIKLNVTNRKFSGKAPNTWKLNNILLNNPQVKEENKKDTKKCFELNEDENTTC